MSNFIPLNLIPPAINDERDRALVGIFGDVLSEFDRRDLVIQDAKTVDAKLLPEMIVSKAMTDFVTPGLREDLLRNLLDNAEEIHALSGTMPGIRRALASLGLSATWVQWFQENPKGPHDTHKAKIFFERSLGDGHEIGDEWHRKAVIKLIDAAKRYSQEVAFSFGVQTQASHYLGVFSRSSALHVAMLPGDDQPPVPSIQFVAATSLFGGTFQAGLEV